LWVGLQADVQPFLVGLKPGLQQKVARQRGESQWILAIPQVASRHEWRQSGKLDQ
jgi:hypothetical protein